MLKSIKTLAGLLPLAGIFGAGCSVQEDTSPNIVVILFDDLGWDDLGVHGNTLIQTPVIDQFAENAAQFDHFYVNPVCAPSRASLLTGRHFLRTGVSHVHGGKDFLSLNEITIADVLSENGYSTAMWGKWHSGDAEKYYPWQRGFQEALSLRLYKHREAEGYFNGEFVTSNRWADELIVDYAIDFMERKKDTPFFAFLSLLSPHTPLVAPEDIVEKYIEMGLRRNLSTLYAMIDFSDQELGRLFKSMDELELMENTIIMILSDNGPAVNRAEISDEDRLIRYVNQFRGHKGDIWENGVKSPLFIRWGNKVNPRHIGSLTSITDIFPTLLDIAAIDYEPLNPLDGISFHNALMGIPQVYEERLIFDYANKGWPPSLVPYDPDGNYNEYQPVIKEEMVAKDQVISLRNPRYKLMINPGIDGDFNVYDSIVLVDMYNDPKESNNLVYTKPDIAMDMKNTLINWYYEVLEEPSSYASPVIFLKEAESTLMRATWVSDISENLLNTVTGVKRWEGTDNWVEYQIMAPENRKYKISLQYDNPRGAKPMGTITVNESMLKGVMKYDGESVIGTIMLYEGLNHLRLNISADENKKNIEELFFIKFD